LLAAGVVLKLYKKNRPPVSPSFQISAMEVPPAHFVKSPWKIQNPAFAPIDLNRAGTEELEELPGFGPALAERILEYREKNGKFKTVQELLRVPGIGPKKLARIKSKVYVSQGVVWPPAGVWSHDNPQDSPGALPKAPKESSMVSSQADLR
jgi:competence ComEA-like helix-hairpin-helix protein